MIVYDDKGQNEPLIYGMWERNFHDPIPYARFYFEQVYPKNQVILWQEDEVMKGMIHWNPYELNFYNQEMPATYIVGVATDKEYRREGVMRKLLAETFMELRKKGQSFTYLMPADENYYLPFDFRYGMSQIEQEIYLDRLTVPTEKTWEYREEPSDVESLEVISEKENDVRNQLFDLHTQVSPSYLRQLNQEAKGDFARMIYVFVEGEYLGRFVLGTEDSYMTLSQLMCVDENRKQQFLEQILLYSENKYHYGTYKIVTDMSWKDTLRQLEESRRYRMLPTKEVPIIMFRILDIVAFAKNIKAEEEKKVQIYIADTKLPVQSGRYIWHATEKGSTLERYNGEDVTDAGKISIADLTDLLFAGGEKKKTVKELKDLTKEGKLFIENLRTIGDVCITEIV